ncbi:hypothetical protein TNCV_583971 [Trichonephila clavipes]|nr:hypothetical protein TNCV_583971 [Trichonephila clavipes]
MDNGKTIQRAKTKKGKRVRELKEILVSKPARRLGGVVGLSLAFCAQGCGFDPGPSHLKVYLLPARVCTWMKQVKYIGKVILEGSPTQGLKTVPLCSAKADRLKSEDRLGQRGSSLFDHQKLLPPPYGFVD